VNRLRNKNKAMEIELANRQEWYFELLDQNIRLEEQIKEMKEATWTVIRNLHKIR
jgi:hypothetical protein